MKNIVATVFLLSFDGVDFVMHQSNLEINDEITKTLETYLKTITKQKRKFQIFETSETSSEIYLKYFVLIDYEYIFDTQAHLFVPLQNYKQTQEIKHIRIWLNEMVGKFDSDVLRNIAGEFFTIDDLHYIYELATNSKTDKGNFHKAIKKKSWLKQTPKVVENVSYRPPQVFTIAN